MSETLSHLDGGPLPKGTHCHDCDINAWNQWDAEQQAWAHEDFYVNVDLWDAVCPDDTHTTGHFPDGTYWRNGTFVLCIGCFEKRLGRKLTAEDFKPGSDPDNWYWSAVVGRPATTRFRDRIGNTSAAATPNGSSPSSSATSPGPHGDAGCGAKD
jgi:hypothetical protein